MRENRNRSQKVNERQGMLQDAARQVRRRAKQAAWIAGGGILASGAIAGAGAWLLWKRGLGKREDVRGQVALITGGSRGLGLQMAREFARAGARLAICARDTHELDWAREELARSGSEVLAVQCDVSVHDDVQRMVREVRERYGRIDILVNNAGIISVGPMESQTLTDYQECMDTMFWGVLYPTLAVLPEMIARRSGKIANITSIGGKVSVPHLLPYSCAKFAAVGFSEGLHAEVKEAGVKVVTIAPGLMRTGSYLNAEFKGDAERESAWFGVSSSLPGLTISGERAARQIVDAAARGTAEKVLTTQANVLAKAHGIAPGLTAEILGLVNMLALPAGKSASVKRGREIQSLRAPLMAALTVFGRMAARRFANS